MKDRVHCRPEAYEALQAEILHLEGSTDSLTRAAFALSLHERPGRDAGTVAAELDSYAETVRRRAKSGQRRAYLARMHELLFDELGFRGDDADYYHPRNSYLPDVVDRRAGLPIALVLVYKHVAERLGIAVTGVGAPGHFLARVENVGAPLLVDPFAGGRALSREDAFRKIEEATGAVVPRDPGLLAPCTHREWISRMIANLLNAFSRAGRTRDFHAMEELMDLLRTRK